MKKIFICLYGLLISLSIQSQEKKELWITGTAVPGGTCQLTPVKEGGQIKKFRYVGALKEGTFKVMSNSKSGKNTFYLLPQEEDIDVTGESLFRRAMKGSSGWTVIVPDSCYKIVVDLIGEKISGGIFKGRNCLYIIGGATEVGWDCGKAIPFVRDKENPNLFIFEGILKIRPEYVENNTFKILGQQDWNPYSLHPLEAGESILISTQVIEGGPDYKWAIDEKHQGRYQIKVDVLNESLQVQYKD